MTKLIVFSLCLSATFWNCRAVPVEVSNCQIDNDAVDKKVLLYNAAVINAHEATADVADFLQDFQMSFLWFTLPMKTNVYAEDGLLTLRNMSRSGDATSCSNSSSKTLQGVFEYDEFTVSYDITAKFFHWQMEGMFSCSIEHPSVELLYIKDAVGCLIVSLDLTGSGTRQCKVSPSDNSWTSWLVGKAIHYALLSKQPSPDSILKSFLQASYSMIETNFGSQWC